MQKVNKRKQKKAAEKVDENAGSELKKTKDQDDFYDLDDDFIDDDDLQEGAGWDGMLGGDAYVNSDDDESEQPPS